MSTLELFAARAATPAAPGIRSLTDRLFEGGLVLLVVTTFAAVCACMAHL